MPAAVRSEDRLAKRSEAPHRVSPWEAPVPSQDGALGSLSHKPANFYTVSPAPGAKRGIGAGRQEEQNKPRGRKPKHRHRETRPSGEDWLLSPRNSFKKAAQLVCADPLWVLLAPPTSQFGILPNSVPLVFSVTCLGNLIVSQIPFQLVKFFSTAMIRGNQCLNKYAKVCSGQKAFQGTKRAFSPFSAAPSSSQVVFVNTSHALEHTGTEGCNTLHSYSVPVQQD